jgi:hypothetical protein
LILKGDIRGPGLMSDLNGKLGSPERTLNDNKRAESSNRKKVWLLGEMGGGLVYSSKDNVIGLARELREQLKTNDAPDIIFWGGEILPKIPVFKTRGGMDTALTLSKSIEAQDDAVVAVKPHLARTLDPMIEHGKKVQVIYAMGSSDRYNVKSTHDLIIKAYDYNPRFIVENKEGLSAKIDSNMAIADECEELKAHAEKGLVKLRVRSDEKVAKLKTERNSLLEKIQDHEIDFDIAELVAEKKRLLEQMKEHAPKPEDEIKERGSAELAWDEKNPKEHTCRPGPAAIRLKEQAALESIDEKITELREEKARVFLSNRDEKKAPLFVGISLRRLDKRIEKKQQKTEKKTAEHNRYILKLNDKTRQNKEEAGDYKKIFALYDELEDLWIKEHPDKKVEEILKLFGDGEPEEELLNRIVKFRGEQGAKEVIAALKAQYEQVNEELKTIERDKEKKKWEELSRKSRSLANLQKKETYTNMQNMRMAAEMKEHERLRGGEIFTHNLSASQACNEKAVIIATEEMLVHIRNAFGRRMHIEIVQENIKDFEIWKGAKIRVSNNPTNTSQTYKKSVIKKLEIEAQMGDSDGLVLVAMSHTPTGVLTIVPKHDNSEEQVRLVGMPPLIDAKKLYDTWNDSIKTNMTETVTSGPVSSGFWEVVFDGKSVSEVFKTSHYLKNKADEEKSEQIKKLADILRHFRPVQVEAKDIDNKDRIQLDNKLPSEMNTGLLNKLLFSNGVIPTDKDAVKGFAEGLNADRFATMDRTKLDGVLKWCLEAEEAGVPQKSSKQFAVLMVNDTHIGTAGFGMPTTKLIRGLTRYYIENENPELPMILFLGGDNIEANHKNIKNEINREISLKNVGDFEDTLSHSKLGEEERRNLLNEYKALLLEKRPIANIDEQAAVFVDAIEPLAKRANVIIAVSGQHFNKTYPNRDRDEAIAITSLIGKKVGEDKAIVPVSGGDTGAGSVQVNGEFGIFAAHRVTNKVKEMATNDLMVFGADIHKEVVEILGDKLVVVGTASSVRTNYPTEMGIPTNENCRGFTLLNITLGDDGAGKSNIEKVETKLISLDLLREMGYVEANPVIEKFERNQNRVEMPLKLIVRNEQLAQKSTVKN